MRTDLGAMLVGAAMLSACIVSNTGPGVLRKDWQVPRRDPDPTRNFTEQPTGNPWTEDEGQPSSSSSEPRSAASDEAARKAANRQRFARGVAGLGAWFVGGWTPLLEMYGTFDEDPYERKKQRRAVRGRSD